MILILGYGMIGKMLYQRLLRQNCQIKVFSNNIETSQKENFIKGNFIEIEKYENIFENVNTVIHLIHTTVPATSFERPVYDLETNVIPTLKMLEMMKKRNIKRLIFVSSGGAVYGNPISDKIAENHQTNPISPYGISKLTIEKYLLFYKYNFDFQITILRPSNIYGIGQDIKKPLGLISHLIYNVFNNKEINIWGDGNSKKDYLYLDDLVDAILLVIREQHKNNFIYNISYGKSYSINQIIGQIKEITDFDINVVYGKEKKFDVQNISIDSFLFKNDYNWKPKFSLKEGINQIVKYYK